MSSPKTVLAIDYGEKRIGVATANSLSRLPSPLTAFNNDEKALQSLVELVEEHQAVAVVIGLPRGLKGQETPQTGLIREFIDLLSKTLSVPVYSQDEDLTSVQAENELKQRAVRYHQSPPNGGDMMEIRPSDTKRAAKNRRINTRRLDARLGRTGRANYNKESVDALAATYILEDFLREHLELKDAS